MNLEVGMYVRTKEGFIAKIEYIDKETGGIDCDSSVETMYEVHYSCLWGNEVEELVVKASHNIIDLIEVGDYVNGKEIIKKFDNEFGKYLLYGSNDGNHQLVITIYEDEIKSIVTKEQFESMNYKVGD